MGVMTSWSADQIVLFDHLNETSLKVLSHGTICLFFLQFLQSNSHSIGILHNFDFGLFWTALKG